MVNIFDVVKYILSKKSKITAMKLQKLVYYCQAWSIVWDSKPLYKENIEAWVNGPVVRELYKKHKGMYEIKKGSSIANLGDTSKLNDVQKETIDAVIKYYGDKSPQWLSDLTHKEDPWRKAREGLLDGERGNQIISLASLEEYYSSLSEDS
jgi:uncharacterized phage-associated protein